MKKHILLLLIGGIVMSCGGNEKKDNSEEKVVVEQKETQQPEAKEEGLDGSTLISSSDCQACHQIETTIIGPAYNVVAEKYQENDTTVTYLANKIIEGGAGNWGTTPMTPHPQHSKEEAEAMVKYILSLNN